MAVLNSSENDSVGDVYIEVAVNVTYAIVSSNNAATHGCRVGKYERVDVAPVRVEATAHVGLIQPLSSFNHPLISRT